MTQAMMIALMNNENDKFDILVKEQEVEELNSLIRKKSIRCCGKYQTFKRKVFDRDGRKCVKCGSNKNLHAHHIKMLSIYPELAFDVNNGITLCAYCHKELHKKLHKKAI